MTPQNKVLDIAHIIRILPHKPPAVLVDRVIEVEPGERILALKNFTANEPYLSGHFPGLPIMPATVLIEIGLQVCCLLAYATESYSPANTVVFLRGMKKANFHRSVFPGDTLEIEAKLGLKRSNVWRFDTAMYVQNQKIAEFELGLSLHERDSIL